MKKKFAFFITVFLLSFFVGKLALAQDGTPIITYTLNGASSNVVINPVINPVQLGFNSDENIENWVSVTIKNKEYPSIYKTFQPGASCDETSECNQPWKGEISPSDKILVDGIYNVIVHIKNTTGITFDLTLTSPYTIQVQTSAPADITPPIIALNGDAVISLNVHDTYIETVTATDNVDGDITANITKGGNPVDTSTAGTYTITYDVSDNAGNNAIQVTRTVTVSEVSTPPSNDALDSVSIHLDIETNNGSLYDNDISVTACDSDNDPNTPDTITPYCAIKQLENLGTPILSDWSWYRTNAFVNSIGGVSSDFNNSKYWTWLVNLDFSNFSLAASQYELHPNDQILFYFDTTPLKISDINLTPEVGSDLDIKVAEPDYGPWPPVWVPSVGGKIVIGSNSFDLDSNGEYKLNITSTDPIIIKGQKNGYINSSSISIIPVVSNEEEDNNGENNGNEGSGSGSNPPILHHKVDIDKALRYLSEKQNSDGSFSSSMYTDWVAIAATAGDNSSLKSSILNYIKANPLNSSLITDNERRAMVLMALDINPYSGTEINYIQKIVDAFDGTQFGDPDEFNDDIFAIFPLIKAGYDINDEMIQKDISFILSKQESDGGWGGVDLTATTIQALSLLPSSEVITQAKIEAEQYLKNSQQADGGFGNSFATSWTLQAISALGEDSSTWTKNDLNPNDYLYSLQQDDGGIEPLTKDEDYRIWATFDAIPAVLNMSWGDIMDTFSKTETEEDNPPRSGLGGTSSSNSLAEKEEKDIIQNDLAEVSQINKVVLPEIKKVSNPKVVVKDTTPEKKTVDIPEPSNNVDLDNNLLASAGSVNLGNFFKDKVIIMTIILTLVTFIGGWFVIKS